MPILFLDRPYIATGLATNNNMTIAVTGNYSVIVQCFEVPPSGIVITIKRGASIIYTAPSLSPTQSSVQFKFSFVGVAGDVMHISITSAAAIDNQKNTVKTIMSFQGGF